MLTLCGVCSYKSRAIWNSYIYSYLCVGCLNAGYNPAMDDELYRSPVVVLRRELEYLKSRLKQERAEALGLERKLGDERSVGLAKLLDVVQKDVEATAELVKRFRRAIRVLEGK